MGRSVKQFEVVKYTVAKFETWNGIPQRSMLDLFSMFECLV